MTVVSDHADLINHILKPSSLKINSIDPITHSSDKVLFYGITNMVMIIKTAKELLKDRALMTLGLNKKYWIWKDSD